MRRGLFLQLYIFGINLLKSFIYVAYGGPLIHE